jgi:hypothetical protein
MLWRRGSLHIWISKASLGITSGNRPTVDIDYFVKAESLPEILGLIRDLEFPAEVDYAQSART